MKRILFSFLLSISTLFSFSQTVPFPTGPRDYEEIEPWGHTNSGTGWNTSQYLPFIYRDMWFRLKPPVGVSYNTSNEQWTFTEPGKKYPVILFFHGAGERGTDNNRQLIHGGQTHLNAVNNGTFPGFLLYPQNVAGAPEKAGALIEKLIAELPVDRNRIYVHGLSNGAKWAWDFMISNPTLPAAMAPMSGVDGRVMDDSSFLFKPLRLAQGGRDTNPHPAYTQEIVDWFNARGGNLEYFLFPSLGHGTWNTMYALPDFFSWFLARSTTTIHVLFKRNEICPEDPLIATLGLTPGYANYQWRRNGALIASGASKWKITVTQHGTYDVRIMNGGVWTDWSTPVEIKEKLTTNTPPIQVSGLRSNVLPAPDGSTSTALELPVGYQTYTWRNSSNQIVSTERIFPNATIGDYTAIVKETYGCSSVASPVFTVIDANGPNKPDAINGLLGFATSQTTIKLQWTDNPSPIHNETGFEIYRATSSSGPYSLRIITAPEVNEFNDSNLLPNTRYYYLIRPVNATAAGTISPVVDVLTELDTQAPTTPRDLRVLAAGANSVALNFLGSTDNIGVHLYNIYVNGVKAMAVNNSTTTVTVFGLTPNQVYNFTVKATDVTGNLSPASNQVTAATVYNGLNYKYYEGTWTNLPDFNTLSPIEIGNTPNIDIAQRNRDTNFAFYWEGRINIPVAGNYTFETNSGDGSKVYIGTYNEADRVVDNNGVHNGQYREGTKNFPTAGSYPIIITYFQATGSFSMNLYWKNTAHGVNSRQLIPNSAFASSFTMPGTPPAAPTNLIATGVSYNQINLTWQDNSNNETGFQLYRATQNNGSYSVVATIASPTTSYSDQNVLPNTKYFYKIQAIGQYGESGFANDRVRFLTYSYYEATMSNLNNIENLTPKRSGPASTFDLSIRDRTNNIGFRWVGKIQVPTTGAYTFFTTSDDGSKLFIDNVQIVNNDFNQGMTERSGSIANLTAGVHDIKVLYRNVSGGLGLEVRWEQVPSIPKQIIPSANLAEHEVNATTFTLPPPPTAPTDLAGIAENSRSIDLTWADNSNTEATFQLYRSVGSAANLALYKTLPANQTSYLDDGLFPRVTYFYRIDAVNSTGGSSSSNIITVTTPNTAPQFSMDISNLTVRHGEEKIIQINAVDDDGDLMIIGESGLPEFAQLFDYGDGNAELFINALVEHIGTYPDLKIYVVDDFGGGDTIEFSMSVNTNFNPVITGAAPITVRESYVQSLTLNATDGDNQPITWTVEGAPSFVLVNPQGNTLQLTASPGLAHAGVYPLVITADDGNGGSDVENITLTVENYNPNFTVSVNFGQGTFTVPTPWNNFTVASNNFTGFTSQTLSALKNNTGATTDIGITVENPWTQATQTGGLTPGIYPNAVMASYFYHSNGVPRTIRITGLNPNGKYNLKFMASRNLNDGNNRTTQFSVGATSATVNANMNSSNTADLNNLIPDSQGQLLVSVAKTVTSGYALINAVVIESVYTGNAPPDAPTSLVASINGAAQIALAWADNSVDEAGFEVYESTDNVNFALAGNTGIDVASFVDGTFVPGTLYYYKVRATNSFGSSAYSNTVQITAQNRAPVFNAIDPISVLENDMQWFTITATDADGDDITFSAPGAPGFMWLETIDNENVSLAVAPSSGDAGIHTFDLIATDSHNAATSVSVSVTVVGANDIKINFTNTTAANLAPLPWNNVNTLTANYTSPFFVNSVGVTTGVRLRLVNAWNVSGGGVNLNGPTGTGLYPDAVTRSSYYINTGDNTTRTIEFTGLNPSKLYEFTFYGARSGVADARIARYTIGTKFVTLNASNNVTNVAKLPGIKSNAAGTATLVISKEAGSYAYINSIGIREYDDSGLPTAPLNATGIALNRSSIRVNWQDASDNETGFQVWRSVGTNANYQLITTLAAGSSTFTNQNLTPGTKYFYKVLASNAIGVSEFSNEVIVSTFDFSVSINYNAFNGGPSNWNNISGPPLITPGMVLNNLFDETNTNTGISQTLVAPFTGDNPWGVNTGSNSGVVPDQVMQGSYWVDPGVEAVLRFGNLSFLKKYNFIFFGSRDATGNRTGLYTIGSTSVSLNAALNSSQTVQINDVTPDPDGTITVRITTGPGAIFAYLNGLIIQATPNPGGAPPPAGRQAQDGIAEDDALSAQVYPNPFTDKLTVKLSRPLSGTTRIQVLSSLGVKVYEDIVDEEELEEIQVQLQDELASGMYILKIENTNTRSVISHRLLRK